jgi:hypothetical protein
MERRVAFLPTTANDFGQGQAMCGCTGQKKFNDIQNCIRRGRYGVSTLLVALQTRYRTTKVDSNEGKLTSSCISLRIVHALVLPRQKHADVQRFLAV